MNRINYKKLIVPAIIFVIACIPAISFAYEGNIFKLPTKEIQNTNSNINEPSNLPVVGTFENFKKMIQETNNYNNSIMRGVPKLNKGAEMQKSTDSILNASPLAAATSGSFSSTNVQVEGVDEADSVKTDGKYIYQVVNNKIVITLAYPAKEMKIVNTIGFEDKNFYPFEIYADSNYLTVIGSFDRETQYNIQQNSKVGAKGIMPPHYRGYGMVRVIVYDIKDKNNIKELRIAEIEGSYVSSRKVDSKLYIVSNKFIDYYLMEHKDLTPIYKDSTVSNEYISIGYDKIKYFPDTIYNNYMIIAALDISNNTQMKVETYLGASQNIYVSSSNLYTAVTKYDFKYSKNDKPDVSGNMPAAFAPESNTNTLIYKFALNTGNIAFLSKGEVPGTILNQFSMDEYNNYFRIATTSGNPWRGGASTSNNNIYVLDSTMNIKGKIEDIAPGEKIYSVRFMGDRGYLVTFQTVDPLFVVDFKDPGSPKILGALKIPGYSNYLQPYDENHIIGFGKDALVLPVKDGKGNEVNTQAYYTGMKIAIFDVSNVQNPVEMFGVKIGDRGTDSEILSNHKALLFSREKNLLALPVNLFTLKEGQDAINKQYGNPQYGTFTYQGAYIYNIDLVKGFTLKGRITHISDEEYKKAGGSRSSGINNVSRILYINDILYTLSMSKIKASNITSLDDIAQVIIPQNFNN